VIKVCQESQQIQQEHLLHPPTNVYGDSNQFIKKHDILQDITLEGLPKTFVPIISISKTF
jgi:hypothetical protein